MTDALALLVGWVLDLLFGDPQRLPHPVVGFGRMIAYGEHRLNRGQGRKAKGAAMAVGLIITVFGLTWLIHYALSALPLLIVFDAVVIFYCLAGTTLIREVKEVFLAVDRSLEEGRVQVARIVGRDTSELSAQEVRTAALETLAENLSDGVIAPLFWLMLLGTPGMLAYKMVNTLDSMMGGPYRRYRQLYPRSSYGPADGYRIWPYFVGKVCPPLRPLPRLTQQRLSRSSPRRHTRLPLRRPSLLLRSALRQALHRS